MRAVLPPCARGKIAVRALSSGPCIEAETLRSYAALMESPHKGKTGLARLRNALRYSLHGLAAAVRHEDAFRQELVLAALLVPLALVLGRSAAERALLVASVLLVLIVELLNSAVEAAVDRVSFEDHRLAKRAKDIGSAAVFVSLVNAVVVWAIVLLG